MKTGTIVFERAQGTEIWKIIDHRFSVSLHNGKYKVNIWAESDDQPLQRLEDTGENQIAVEVVFTLERYPIFSKEYVFELPVEVNKDYEETADFFTSWYYYEHRDIEECAVQVIQSYDRLYSIELTGQVEDPIETFESSAKMIVRLEAVLESEFEGFWAR